MPIIIPLKQIKLRDYNRDDKDDVGSLAESIREHGLLNPIIVTEIKKNQYQLIAGERRLRAVQQNGEDRIACNLVNADELKQQKLNLAENLQRKDLTIWEESKHLQELKNLQPELRVEDIAVQVGRSAPWVAHRLQLGRLHKDLRDIFQSQNWPISHVCRLARYSHDFQGKIAREIRGRQGKGWARDWVDNITKAATYPPLNDLISFIDDFNRLLKSAIWKLDDADLLPRAGACSSCPKRSSQHGLLFQEPGDDDADTCLDPECYQEKKVAFVKLSIEKLKEGKQKPIYLGNTYDAPVKGLPKAEAQSWQYQECKQSTPGAMPAIHVSGRDLGKTVWVTKERFAAERQTSRKNINQETGKPAPPSNKERLQALTNKRLCQAVEFWMNDTLPDLKPVLMNVLPLLGTFGSQTRKSYINAEDWKDWKLLVPLTGQDLADQLYQDLYPVLADRCARHGTLEDGSKLWKEAMQQAGALGCLAQLMECWASAINEVKFPNSLIKAGVADPHKADEFPELEKPKKAKK